MTPVRIGIVGFGKIAKDEHVPALAHSGGFALIATASHHAHAEGLPGYPSLEAMLKGEPDLQAVELCQPPRARFAAARTAILAGRHVLLEKPPGVTLSEVRALADLAKARGVTLFTAWHSRYAGAVPFAKAWLCDKSVQTIAIVWKEDVRVWHPGQTWIWQPGGFGVFDPGINALSILTEIIPGVTRVISAQLAVPINCSAPIAAEIEMETGSGALVTAAFDFRQTARQSWDITIATDRGVLGLHNGGHTLSIDGQAGCIAAQSEYANVYRRFSELIDRRESDVDLAPLRLIADTLLCGGTSLVEPFDADGTWS